MNSLPLALDRENPNLGRYSASRRVSRTIYMGSAPIQKAANRGIEDRQVKLGCVQPGEAVATFGGCLASADRPGNVSLCGWQTVLVFDAAHRSPACRGPSRQLTTKTVMEEIADGCGTRPSTRGDFAKVHACVPSGDVPDEKEARLVIIGPDHPHTAKDAASAARKGAAQRVPWRKPAQL